MPRITDPTILSKLNDNRYEMYDYIVINGNYPAPYNGNIYLTNYPIDITVGGNNYLSLGAFLGISEIQESSEFSINGINITVSGLPPRESGVPGYLALFLDEDWKDQFVTVGKLFIDDPSDPASILTVVMFDGYTTGANYGSEPGGTSQITVTVQTHFATFEKITGRRNNPSEAGRVPSKLYNGSPNPEWQLIPGAFNDFSGWTALNYTSSTAGFASAFGHKDVNAFTETAVSGEHKITTPVLGDFVAGTKVTFSIFVGWWDRSEFSITAKTTESGEIFTSPIYNVETGILSIGGLNSQYIEVGMYDDGYQHPTLNRFYQNMLWITFQTTADCTNLQFVMSGYNGSSSYLGDGSRLECYNAIAYTGDFNEDRSFKMTEHYDYIPDQMFRNSALTNLKIRWTN